MLCNLKSDIDGKQMLFTLIMIALYSKIFFISLSMYYNALFLMYYIYYVFIYLLVLEIN